MRIIGKLITKYDNHLVNLVSRLDFDGFYSDYLNINKGSNSMTI